MKLDLKEKGETQVHQALQDQVDQLEILVPQGQLDRLGQQVQLDHLVLKGTLVQQALRVSEVKLGHPDQQDLVVQLVLKVLVEKLDLKVKRVRLDNRAHQDHLDLRVQ